jgi:hypothetical protein
VKEFPFGFSFSQVPVFGLCPKRAHSSFRLNRVSFSKEKAVVLPSAEMAVFFRKFLFQKNG